MERRKNPFHELYLTESVSAEKYVQLFSPILIKQALALFEPGHVILKGLPGTGKSMLLGLLKPAVRIAYAEQGAEFPVPKGYDRFIGAGIHLKRSGVSDFGQRPISRSRGFKESPFYFADFLNYWISLDILRSIESLRSLSDDIGISLDQDRFETFSRSLIKHHCWNGYLSKVDSYSSLKKRIEERILAYRNFLNYNTNELPESIKSTKTDIGIPILEIAKRLKSCGIISESTEIFVRIDQYEELAWLEDLPDHIGISYQEMIRKLLAMRDTSVSYRIGTRYFAWNEAGKIFGTTAKLEKGRHYADISIDTLLRRKENRRTWVFPEFAEDILERRVHLSGLKKKSKSKTMDLVFGSDNNPSDEAKNYLKSNKQKAIRLEENWPTEWKNFLKELAQKDPLSARLGEAWCRQRGKIKKSVMQNIPRERPYPWDEKKWWKKERIEQALLQIASRNNQQLVWHGKDDIISLCGSNILAFLFLCRSIWDVWIRDTEDESGNIDYIRSIDPEIQSVGVFEASNSWYQNIALEIGGKERKLFINFLGAHFYKVLVEDVAMSNPGNNGFSLDVEELEKNKYVKNFLDDSTDYGDLYDAPHTSKLSDKRPRKKWYLNPILSPYFKIPSVHTKEPIYNSVEEVEEWIKKATKNEIVEEKRKKKSNSTGNTDSSQTKLNF